MSDSSGSKGRGMGSLIVFFLLGAALGAGGISGARKFGIDPAAKFVVPAAAVVTPAKDEKEKDKDGKKGSASVKELELRRMLAEVKHTREQLQVRENELLVRENEFTRQQTLLEGMQKKIDQASTDLNIGTIEKDEVDLKNIKKLAKLWSQMEVPDVCKIINAMDEEFVARVLREMNAKQAAPVLAALAGAGPDGSRLAASLSKRLREMRIVAPAKRDAVPGEGSAEAAPAPAAGS